MVKKLLKICTHIEPVAVRMPLRLGPGRGTEGSTAPPGTHQKT